MQIPQKIPLFLQEISELHLPKSDAIREGFNGGVMPHLKYHREHGIFSTEHYLLHSIHEGEVVSFLYFTVTGSVLDIVVAFTSTGAKHKGHMKKLLHELFDSDLAKKALEFRSHFAPFTNEERIKFHDYVVAWFTENGPSKKWLEDNSELGVLYHIAK